MFLIHFYIIIIVFGNFVSPISLYNAQKDLKQHTIEITTNQLTYVTILELNRICVRFFNISVRAYRILYS